MLKIILKINYFTKYFGNQRMCYKIFLERIDMHRLS